MRFAARSLFVAVLMFVVSHAAKAQDDPPPAEADESEVAISTIGSDTDKAFGKATRIDFEKDPAGALLAIDANISKTFVPLGVTFETSFGESHIAVVSYHVREARSAKGKDEPGSRCAANHDPLYQGTMTIRFCKPGDASIPATVRAVGCWVAHVVPMGTALEAYDAGGKLIGKVEVKKAESDFLGLASMTPIAYIKIVTSEHDLDFAIDDLVFDEAKPIKAATGDK